MKNRRAKATKMILHSFGMKPADESASSDSAGFVKVALPTRSESQIRAFSVVLGLVLIPLVSLWVASMENIYGGRPTYLSIFFHAVLILAILVGINSLLGAISQRLTLTRAEMLLIYIMICVSSGIVGDQFMAILIPSLVYPFRHANEVNRWADRLLPYLPRHAVVSDPVAVRNFYEGGSTLYIPDNYMPWLRPGLLWASFIAVVQLMCLSINVLMRRQWTQNEKLTFPLITIPLEVTKQGVGSLWRNKLMWTGFTVSATIDIINGLSYHFPSIPYINVKVRWIRFPAPWDAALTTTGIAFFPFIIGTAYLLPSDLTFSTWFFVLLFRFERFLFAALGYPSPYPWATMGRSVPPAMLEQGIGGYIAVVALSLWAARTHLKGVWRAIRGISDGDSKIASSEALEYRLAMGMLIIGFILTTLYGWTLGMPIYIAFTYILLYLVLNTAIAKIRAEAGAPTHGFHFAGPDHVLLTIVSPSSMDTRQMAAWALFFGFNRAYTGVPMPHQLEGMKIAEVVGANIRKVMVSIALATVAGCYAGVWALLHLCFREGVERMGHPVKDLSPQGWQIVDSWLNSPVDANLPGLLGIIFGFGFAVFLMLMRYLFVWWPFHPIGYTIAADWTSGVIWLPLLIGWCAKALTLHYGGRSAYLNFLPMALGLILGEFAVGGFWSLLAMFTRKPQYSFWPW